MNYVLYLIVASATRILELFPRRIQEAVISGAVHLARRSISRFDRVARKNIEIVFPDSTEARTQRLMKSCERTTARILLDFLRIRRINDAWLTEHVRYPALEEVRRLREEHPGKGFIIATGHLGSFELLAHILCRTHRPFSFVVRNFKNKHLDSWWHAE